MAALTTGVNRPGATADLGPGGPPAARTTRPAGEDRSAAVSSGTRTVRSWPLLVLAAPAAAEVWSGWVGIAQKTGFGLVSPLPGIWPSLHLDTAITLPVGVEAYAGIRAAGLAGPRPHDQLPDPPVRQKVRDLLLRARHGRANRLPPAGPRRDGTGTVARHHDRVLPAGPGPGHGGPPWPTCCAPMPAPQRTRRAAGPQDQQCRGPQPGPRTRLVRPRTGPHLRFPWPGPILPQGRRSGSRITTPGRQHQAWRASARPARSPAGSQRREGRYPDVPCAARESGAPTRSWAPWRARSTPSCQAKQLSRPDPATPWR
jgi:hypothetical protein